MYAQSPAGQEKFLERKVREYRLSARRPTNEMPKPRFLCAGLHPFGVVVAFSRLVAGCGLRNAWVCVCQVGFVQSVLPPLFLLPPLRLLHCDYRRPVLHARKNVRTDCCRRLPASSIFADTSRKEVEIRPGTFNFTY